MIYTQVAGVTNPNILKLHSLDKYVHQVYSSAVPINTYRNGGDLDTQLAIARNIILAEYIGIILHVIDKKTGKTNLPRPRVNLTLIGPSVFNVPESLVISCIHDTIQEYNNYSFDIYIHSFRNDTAYNIKRTLGINIVPFGTDLQLIGPTAQQLAQPTAQLPQPQLPTQQPIRQPQPTAQPPQPQLIRQPQLPTQQLPQPQLPTQQLPQSQLPTQ